MANNSWVSLKKQNKTKEPVKRPCAVCTFKYLYPNWGFMCACQFTKLASFLSQFNLHASIFKYHTTFQAFVMSYPALKKNSSQNKEKVENLTPNFGDDDFGFVMPQIVKNLFINNFHALNSIITQNSTISQQVPDGTSPLQKENIYFFHQQHYVFLYYSLVKLHLQHLNLRNLPIYNLSSNNHYNLNRCLQYTIQDVAYN